MAYGLQVREGSALNKVTYDTASVAWLQVDQFIVPAGTTVTKGYENLEGFNIIVQQQMIGEPANDQESLAPKITIRTVTRYLQSNLTRVIVAPYDTSSVSVIIIVLAQG